MIKFIQYRNYWIILYFELILYIINKNINNFYWKGKFIMEPDLTGIWFCAFLGGGLLTFIGSIVKFFNAGDILNFYDEKKHDKDKVSKIVGNDMIYTGLGVFFIAIISIFLSDKYYYAMMMTQIAVIIIGLLVSLYHFFWTCIKK